MTIALRPLAEADLALVSRWFDDEARRWLGGPEWPAKSLRLVAPGRHSLLAVGGDGSPVGLIDLELYADGRASFAIAVDNRRRRQGLGVAVVEALLGHPALTRVSELFAGVEEGNAASARLLLRCGFVAVTGVDADGFRYVARPAPSGAWALPVD